mgnify:FL=1
MNSKALIIGILILAAAGIFFPRFFDGANASAVDSSLVAHPLTYDFGEISMGDGIVRTDYTVSNDGASAILIQDVFTSCMCTKAEILDSSGRTMGIFGMGGHEGGASGGVGRSIRIAPGGTVTVRALFDPAAHGPAGVGLASRSIYIKTNSRQTPDLEVRFSALVEN